MDAQMSHYPINVLGAYAKNVITVSEKPVHSVVLGHVLLEDVKSNYAGFFAVFGKLAFSGLGESVEEADVLRDEPLRAIKSILKGFAKMSGTQFQTDALPLLTIFDQLGDRIDQLSYGAENESLNKLFAEWDGADNTARLTNLNLTELYGTLKRRHAGFMQLYMKQLETNAELHRMEAASDLRNKLSASLRNYLNLVTAMRAVPGWGELYAELDEVSKAANRSARSGGKKDPDTEPTI